MLTIGRGASRQGWHPEVAGITIRSALALGVGVTVAVWLWSGYDLTARMSQLEAETSAINRRFTRAQQRLSSVRTQILLGSLGVRDALLEPAPDALLSQRDQFDKASRLVREAMAGYEPVVDSADARDRLERLRREIADYERSMQDALNTDDREWPLRARAALREHVVPRRQTVIDVADQVQALNSAALMQQRSQTAALYRDAERNAWVRLGGALAVSLAIGLVAALYARRLETRVKQQRLRDWQLTRDLHRLSGRLATAQEDERRAIARDLHDEVGQSLTALKVELSLAQRADDLPAPVAARLDQARQITDGALDAVRNLSHLLHPPLLDDLGLGPAMASWLQGFATRHGIDADLVQDQPRTRLPPEVETALYRIVQEALTNVAKHARARTCHVRIAGDRDSLRVTIEDDGIGFTPEQLPLDPHAGLGLISIRERVAQLGGSLRIDSAPGQGARLLIELPMPAPTLTPEAATMAANFTEGTAG